MTARSPRGPLTVAVLPLLLLAGACSEEPKVVVKVKSDTAIDTAAGSSIEAAEANQSLSQPTDLPAFAPAYPGARLTTRIGGDAPGGRGGTLLVFETADAVERIAAFYDARARDAGAKAAVMVTEPDSAVRIYGSQEGGRGPRAQGAMVAISRSDEGPGSEIVITSGLPDEEVASIERKPDEWRRAVRMPVRLQ